MPFNKGQLKAIHQRKSSILVSAPAGSGKTKILVTRIIELLKEGYTIHNFLVLTFTEAAGNEMKQRLSEELTQLIQDPTLDSKSKQHLNTQIRDLPNAYITNFHGFCNTLLMKYGYLINIMPGFSINSDPTLLKEEVFEQCMEEWIQQPQFKQFFSLYFPSYNKDKFKSFLFNIDNISHSIDNFYSYIEDIFRNYYDIDLNNLEQWPLFKIIQAIFYDEALLSLEKLIELKTFCEEHNITDFYNRPDEQSEKNQALPIPFEAYFEFFDELQKTLHPNNTITFDTLTSLVTQSLPKTYTMSWKEIDPSLKSQFNSLKKDVSSSFKSSVTKYLPTDLTDLKQKLLISKETLSLLLSQNGLLYQFQEHYQQLKRSLNQLDFADLEKYAHQLLEPQYGIVEHLYQSLKEIMIDEYQDTNQIQESLILKISQYQQPPIPLFMVGDMKQSIYRFRQADPMIFLNKYNTFSQDDTEALTTHQRRIDLVFNYRSSKVVLDSINYIFNQIMDTKIGGLEYYRDDSARLNYDFDGIFPHQQEQKRQEFFQDHHLTTELLLDLYDPNSAYDKEQYEAHMVAQKIIHLINNFKIKNKPISYKDIAVLMRSTTSFLTFKKVFDQYNIPNHITLSQGLMSSLEVQDILTLLKAINNPYDDISLMSVLKQPYTFSNISLEKIAFIRKDHKDISLYECLQLSQDEEIIQFLHTFHNLINLSYQCSPYDLLLELYEQTDYQLFVSQLINSEQRKANLDLLLEIIKQQQTTTPYLKDLLYALEHSSDYAPATLASTDNDNVEFMTIHKSKGLEFPVVFVCNTHKKFNTQDSKENFIIDKQLGIAIKPRTYTQTEEYNDIIVEHDNVYRNIIARKQLDESINEEMRIFYVALTRASAKLIMTGMIKDMEELRTIQRKLIVNESPDILQPKGAEHVILYNHLRHSNNYLTWILSSLLRHPNIIQQCLSIDELSHYAHQLNALNTHRYLNFPSTEHAQFSMTITNDQEITKNIPLRQTQQKIYNTNNYEKYSSYQYPYDLRKPTTIAVTKLHNVTNQDKIQASSDKNAATKGTLVHLLLSYLTFDNDNILELIEQLHQEQLINEEEKQILYDYQEPLQQFIDSEYYQMIKQSQHIYKEKPFAYYDNHLNQTVHGIFDLVFVYHDKIYVLDYKTDRVKANSTDEQLIAKHQFQLDYYKKVLKEMYHQDIIAITYYLHINKGVYF